MVTCCKGCLMLNVPQGTILEPFLFLISMPLHGTENSVNSAIYLKLIGKIYVKILSVANVIPAKLSYVLNIKKNSIQRLHDDVN